MALGATAGLLMAGGIFSATSYVMAGNAQSKAIKKQSEFDAQIYDQQAAMIKEKKKIQDYQYSRNAARARSSAVASTAGRGFLLSGSPLAMMIDTETEMGYDKAIQDYNLEVESSYAKSGATYMRQTGKNQARLAKYKGYSGAFSQMMNTGVAMSIAGMEKPLKTTSTKYTGGSGGGSAMASYRGGR